MEHNLEPLHVEVIGAQQTDFTSAQAMAVRGEEDCFITLVRNPREEPFCLIKGEELDGLGAVRSVIPPHLGILCRGQLHLLTQIW